MNNTIVDPALPEFCGIRVPGTNEPAMLKRGECGYYPWPYGPKGQESITPEKWNADHGITEAQVLAMTGGSMFGWHVPGARVDRCQETIDRAKERNLKANRRGFKRFSEN